MNDCRDCLIVRCTTGGLQKKCMICSGKSVPENVVVSSYFETTEVSATACKIKCLDCGVIFQKGHNVQKMCVFCINKHKNEKRKERICLDCGVILQHAYKRCAVCGAKRRAERKRERRQIPEVKERERRLNSSPECKERVRQWKQKPEVKEALSEYYKERYRKIKQTPEYEKYLENQAEYRKLRRAEKVQSQLTYLIHKLITITKEQDNDPTQNGKPT